MSAMKNLVVQIMSLWAEGMTVEEISDRLRVDPETVDNVVDEYSNFFD